MCESNFEIPQRSIDRFCFLLDRRLWVGVAVCVGLIFAMTAGDAAAQNPGSDKLVIEDKALITRDGWQVWITYFQSNRGKESPVVLLLHGKGGNRIVWGTKSKKLGPKPVESFAVRLQKEGYAVIALDLRKHGDSKNPAGAAQPGSKKTKKGFDPSDLHRNDCLFMVAQDLEAVKAFIYEEHQAQKLNMRKMAIVAPDMAAPIAINFALADWLKQPYKDAPVLAACTPRGQDVRALILLSPDANLSRLRTGRPLAALGTPVWGISFLICVAAGDKLDRGQAKKMYQQLSGISQNADRMYLQNKYAGRWRGTNLFGKKNRVEEHVLVFLQKHLQKLPDPWRDRKSRLMK